MNSARSIFAYGELFLLAVLWGMSFNLTKVAVSSITPMWVVAGRVTLAAVFLFIVLKEKHHLWSTASQFGRQFALQACLMGLVPWGLIAWSSRHLDSGATAILGSTTPVFAFLITWLITRHEPATLRKIIGTMLGLAGVAVMIGLGSLRGSGITLAAQLACVLASIIYGVAAIHGRRLSHVPPLVAACATMFFASAAMIPLSLVVEGPPPLPGVKAFAALVVLGVLCTGGALILYYRLLGAIGSIATTSNNYLRIGVGVVVGVLFLGEPLTNDKLIGLLLVGTGVYGMVSGSSTSRPVT